MPYLIALVLIGIGGVVYYTTQTTPAQLAVVPEPTPLTEPAPENTSTTPPPSDSVIETTTATDAPTNDNDYKNGTFATNVTYLTPKRDEYGVNVSLTLINDIITESRLTYSAGAEKDPNAARFAAAYEAQVIGKDIDTINLSRVGGASLTTAAFNNALDAIKADARS